MPSRTDLVHSYQFRTRRVLSALVMRETDPRQSPLRRGVGAVFGGLMITVVAAAGFGIYGLITKVGGDDWRRSGSVVIERETGASFVFINEVLYPTLNLASAMLAAGQANPTIHRVASTSLQDVARGFPIGIPGAPDSLPPAGRQIGLPWSVCASTPVDDQAGPVVSLVVGVAPAGGRALGDNGLLVTDAASGASYLIWDGYRHVIPDAPAVLTSLYGDPVAVEVGPAWLNALPAGVDIAPIEVARAGETSTAMPAYDNGDILVLPTVSGSQHYLVLDDGKLSLTPLEKGVQEAAGAGPPIDVRPSDIVDAPDSAARDAPGEGALPATAPPLDPPARGELTCATTHPDPDNRLRPGTWAASVTVGARVDGLERSTPTTGVSPDRTPLADTVLVPAGRVAVIRAVAAPQAPMGPYLVVTDLGISYPVSDPDLLPMLGYSAAAAVDIPATLAKLLPTGPTLDRAAALDPVAPLRQPDSR
jgi:type VII secretion protein EccB